jgi:hypothetical protein
MFNNAGMVDTPLFRRFIVERFSFGGGILGKGCAFIARQIAYRRAKFETAEQAASCPVYLASSADVAGVTGKHFYSDRRVVETSPASCDLQLSRRIWSASAELCGLAADSSQFAVTGQG